MSSFAVELRDDDQDKESARFFKAKESLFKQDWDAARSGLERYLRDYPSGRLTAEALYWYAHCLNRISSSEKDIDRVISLKTEALLRLNDLVERYKQEGWAIEATVLRSRLSRDLSFLGRPEFSTYIVPSDNRTREASRPAWLTLTVAQLTPEAAFPVLLRLGRSDPTPQVRTMAHFLLARDYRETALPELLAASTIDPDEHVRSEAAALIERVRMNEIPVRLKFYVFVSDLTTQPAERPIDEGKLNVFTIPHGLSGQDAARDAIQTMWGDKIINLAPAFRVPEAAADYFGALSESHYMVENFVFNFLNSDLKKEQFQITGTVKVFDRLNKVNRSEEFSTDSARDQLVVIRRSEKAVFILFQFEAGTETDAGLRNPLRKSILNAERERANAMRSTIIDLWGISVRTTRQFWPMNDAGSAALSDFGIATAEIPGAGGKWVLQGHILCDIKSRLFIGRQFTLADPQGKVVAQGAYVEVPALNPQAYVFPPTLKQEAGIEEFYQRTSVLFTDQEQKIYGRIQAPEDRARVIEDFRKVRDFDPATDNNEARKAFEQRTDIASRTFSPRMAGKRIASGDVTKADWGWNTEAGRIFVLLGPPDSVRTIEGFNASDFAGANSIDRFDVNSMTWDYFGFALRVGVSRSSTGDWGATGAGLRAAMDFCRLHYGWTSFKGGNKPYLQFDSEYDDGALRMRFPVSKITLTGDPISKKARIKVLINVYRDLVKADSIEIEIVRDERGSALANTRELHEDIVLRPEKPGKYLLDIVAWDLQSKTPLPFRQYVEFKIC